MCFGNSSPPAPKQPPPPPSALQANQEGTRARQEAARRAKMSGLEATMTSGPGGVTDAAPVLKPTLGS
jgi:hypothetical protein